MKMLRLAAALFACIALTAGALQLAAFIATSGPRHLVVGIFALWVGGSVVIAVISSWYRDRRNPQRGHHDD
jgi:hypothetical protein